VTISRARRGVLVFTPDRKALRRAIESDGHRPLAIEGKKSGEPVAMQLNQAHRHRIIVEQNCFYAAHQQSLGRGMRMGM
jgi:hypothetical protein